MVRWKGFKTLVDAMPDILKSVPDAHLLIIGDGPERRRLQKMAGPTIEFVGLVSEEYLPDYYAHARALIFPQEEDFGISALESMAAGRPVIAYKKGGALEFVEEGKTGLFFGSQTPKALIEALYRFENMPFEPYHIREHVRKYDRQYFLEQIQGIIKKRVKNH